MAQASVAPNCRKSQRGASNPAWKGGKTIVKGYLYRYFPGHPMATIHGYVLEHRLTIEAHLGRYLESAEVVHHKNGDITDNSIGNLEVFASNSAHLAKSLKGKCPNWSPDGWQRMQDAAHDPERIANARALRGVKHPRAVLTKEKVAAIRTTFAVEQTTRTALAKKFGVSRSTIGRLLAGKTYT